MVSKFDLDAPKDFKVTTIQTLEIFLDLHGDNYIGGQLNAFQPSFPDNTVGNV